MKYHHTNRQLNLFKIYAYQFWVHYVGYSTAKLKNELIGVMKRKKSPRHTKRKFFGGRVSEIY